tara:strand:- start:43887 stop:44186 length:300 start_codon:yes stop_codon:yes gene_type:complete
MITEGHKVRYIIMGYQFGYPKCCVSHFLKRVQKSDVILRQEFMYETPKKLSGTGYIPCPHCNETKTEEELIKTINTNRKVTSKFPDECEHSEIMIRNCK